jgi:hypothetical protein
MVRKSYRIYRKLSVRILSYFFVYLFALLWDERDQGKTVVDVVNVGIKKHDIIFLDKH